MFSFFKRNDKNIEPINFDSLVCDMHSHLIPGIDDGSPDLETSVQIIKNLQSLGFKKFMTTPHIMQDFYRNTPDIILSGLKDLQNELKKQSIDVEISAAAEYYIDYDFESKVDSGDKFLTIGDNHLLIETSFISAPPNFGDIIFKLQLAGYKLILAHPERYGFMTFEDLQSYKTRSLCLQLNLLSLLGYYGPPAKAMAEKLIENNMVDYVATDCHNLHQSSLYSKCFTNKHWHMLVNRETLKNQML
tara:strand:+ start:4036 stop:4773 length:738 start_codon:yes stop_codon:yes gene_type:complete